MGSLSLFGPIDRNKQLALAAAGNPAYTGVSLHSSAQALPIPLHWGTRRIAPNLIWMGNSPNVTAFQFALQPVCQGPDAGTPGTGYSPTTTPPANVAYVSLGFTPPGGWQGAVYIINGSHNGLVIGSTDSTNPNIPWWNSAILGLCAGPINSISRIWNGGGATAQTVQWPTGTILGATGTVTPTYNRTLPVPSLFYTLFTGDTTQTAWGYFAFENALAGGPYYTGQDIAYRGLAYIASATMFFGTNNQPPQQAFEVVRTPNLAMAFFDSYTLGKDYGPETIVVDLLTNSLYGLGLQSSDLDAPSFATYLQYTLAQGLLLSPLLDAQTAGVQIIDRIATETNSWIYWDGTKVRCVPLGDESLTGNGQTYTPDTTPAYNLSNSDFLQPAGLTVQRANPYDCNNRVRLEFPDRFSDYAKNAIEWKDSTLINQVGIRDASSIAADDICDVLVAAKAIDLYGKRMAYIRNLYTFSLSYQGIRILPGTIVTLTDPNLGLSLVPVRVRSVEENEKGELAIIAEEYPGTLGIARVAVNIPSWTPNSTTGATGGSSTSGSGGMGGSTSTSGGVLTQSVDQMFVEFVAGDVITLPPDPLPPGRVFTYKHDQLRSPQPADPKLETNPVTFKRPATGATYLIEDPQDGTAPAATSVTGRGQSGTTYRFAADSAGVVRVL